MRTRIFHRIQECRSGGYYRADDGHLTTIGNPGMLESMIRGNVRKIRVKKHRPKWHKEIPGQEKNRLTQERGMPQTGRKREHLRRTAFEHPEYREILSLFQSLFAYIEGKEDATGIAFAFPDGHGAERVSGGLPLLAPKSLRVEQESAAAFLSGILDVMREASRDPAGKEELERIGRAIEEKALDLSGLFAACLCRERKVLEEAAAAIPVSAPLLTFVLELPLKTALSLAAESVDPGSVAGWTEGHCPVCGSRPGMDELAEAEGKRYLCCSSCSFRWSFPRIKCPYCGNQDPETLSCFIAGDDPTRMSVCRKCRRYIKTRDSRIGNADVPLEAEDLSTLHLDLLAAKEGFERGK
jgi:FdhE protein